MKDPRPIGDVNDVKRSLKVGRTSVEKLLRTDPAFPKPWMILNKRVWFMDEVEDYKQAQPRRQYAEMDDDDLEAPVVERDDVDADGNEAA